MSSPLLDEDLREILVLRWQLCEADLPAGEDLPYSAAWTRAQLLYQVLTGFSDIGILESAHVFIEVGSHRSLA